MLQTAKGSLDGRRGECERVEDAQNGIEAHNLQQSVRFDLKERNDEEEDVLKKPPVVLRLHMHGLHQR